MTIAAVAVSAGSLLSGLAIVSRYRLRCGLLPIACSWLLMLAIVCQTNAEAPVSTYPPEAFILASQMIEQQHGVRSRTTGINTGSGSATCDTSGNPASDGSGYRGGLQ